MCLGTPLKEGMMRDAMKILVACESSGIVRDAFAAAGHDVWSCDLLPYSGDKPDGNIRHIQADVRDVLAGMLDEMKGGIRLQAGAEVFVKLNLCLLKGPETGATVEPNVARALVEWLLANYDLGFNI